MVPLTSVPSEFAGRVLVAKLGSAGILAELRGVSRVYPSLLGEPHVWVEAAEFADARELITTDVDSELAADAESSAVGAGVNADGSRPASPVVRVGLAAVAVVVLVSFGYGARSCGGPTIPASSHTR